MTESSSLAFGSHVVDPVVEAFLRDQVGDPHGIDLSIDEKDEMLISCFTNDPIQRRILSYFKIGLESARTICQLATSHFGRLDGNLRLLDFASGYGRTTRFLVHELSPSAIWVSDIYREAIEFQKEQFGVHGIVSVADPEAYDSPVSFDMIYVASLFSHLPAATFTRWLAKLYSLLSPGGLLAFSVHDERLLPPGAEMPPDGLLFRAKSESRTLDPEQYGSTWVREDYVARQIARVTGNRGYQRLPAGLCHFQDIYLVTKSPAPAPSLRFDYSPEGHVEECKPKGDAYLQLSGWCAVRGSRINDIQVLADGVLIQRCMPVYERQDVVAHYHDAQRLVSGWYCMARLPRDCDPERTVSLVKAFSDRGMQRVLDVGLPEARQPKQ